MLNGLDLFSGIGGMSIALREWVKPVIYCEIEPYCQGVLLSRMADESLSNCPIWDDIRTLSGLPFNGSIDIIYGGFPCQDISITGNGKGLEGKRSRLFFEIIRLLRETGSRFLFLENVPAITKRGGVEIIKILTSMGYDCRWCVISASSVGSVHKRERWFLLANSNSKSGSRLQLRKEERQSKSRMHFEYSKWEIWDENKPKLLGMDDEIPNRLDRTKSLGNAVVPEQAKKAFEILIGRKNASKEKT